MIVLGSAGLSVGCSTSSSQDVDPFGAADEADPNAVLDAPIRPRQPKKAKARQGERSATVDQAKLMLPLPAAEMSKTIDGKFDEWNRRKTRPFGGTRNIAAGEEFWNGDKDAGFRVGIDSDEGYIYFSIAVQDEKVIDAESKDIMSDGVIIWVQDPKLQTVIESLPDGMAEDGGIGSEVAILFTPDGQFWRYDRPDGPLHRAGITARTEKTDNGYNVEVALALGVLGQVATLPTEAVAFRVELVDGDEAARRGEQTRMSMLPDTTGPRFARYEVGGWLPFASAIGQPPRQGSLGRWVLGGDAWRYKSFEVVPNHWLVLQETQAFENTLNEAEVFDKLCPQATNERRLIEAYQSTRGTLRAGLFFCGARAPKNRCPKDGQTKLYWVNLQRSGEDWTLARYSQVTEKPLPQCAGAPQPGGEFYSGFSLLPLEMLGPTVWGIGWEKTYSDSRERSRVEGVWFANPELKSPFMGTAISERKESSPRARTLSKSHVYLALVDDIRGLDICEVERIEEQQCNRLDVGCITEEHGKSVQVHVKLWSPHKQRFETYLQTKHRGCSPTTFDFNTRRGFMLLTEPGRLGALASPANRGAKGKKGKKNRSNSAQDSSKTSGTGNASDSVELF